MIEPPILIKHDELFDPAVDKALARERAGRERIVADPPPVSRLRALLFNGMFYSPLAGLIGALITWAVIEPDMDDVPSAAGEIALVNTHPIESRSDVIGLTVGRTQVLVTPHLVVFEAGARGERPLTGAADLKVGARIEVAGIPEQQWLVAAAIRPAGDSAARDIGDGAGWGRYVTFPLVAALIAFGLLLAEGIATRNWTRMLERTLLGSFLAVLFTGLAFIPAGLTFSLAGLLIDADADKQARLVIVTVKSCGAVCFLLVTACRSAAWAFIGTAVGLGMNLVRATRAQLRNSVIGGAMGGAVGGLFFDPIDRWSGSSLFASSSVSRGVGLAAVGVSIGIFVALVERLGRDAWLRVRTGPLAGKSFILYKTPSIVGSSPQADIYLYKDAEIEPSHLAVHRVGTTYELEDLETRTGTSIGGSRVHRQRLLSGDQIVIGSTILDFEERQKRTHVA